MSRQADIRQAITAIPVAMAKGDEAAAVAAALTLAEGALSDLARIADALETIAGGLRRSAPNPLYSGDGVTGDAP